MDVRDAAVVIVSAWVWVYVGVKVCESVGNCVNVGVKVCVAVNVKIEV